MNKSLVDDSYDWTNETSKNPKWEYIVLYIIPIGTVWGNVFVCLAVYLERRLRHRFNLFLVSLALSDLLCALLVMPVSAWHMIMGRNDNDLAFCLVWYSLDIFFTATTIIHLCNISLDRYLALKHPFGSARTRPNLLNSLSFRIVLSWLISFSIAGPLFLFALKQQEKKINQIKNENILHNQYKLQANNNNNNNSNYDKELINIKKTINEKFDSCISYKGCGPNDPSFVLTAIGVTFVLPLIIMIVTYILTIQTLRKHMKQIRTLQLHTNKTIVITNNIITNSKRTTRRIINNPQFCSNLISTTNSLKNKLNDNKQSPNNQLIIIQNNPIQHERYYSHEIKNPYLMCISSSNQSNYRSDSTDKNGINNNTKQSNLPDDQISNISSNIDSSGSNNNSNTSQSNDITTSVLKSQRMKGIPLEYFDKQINLFSSKPNFNKIGKTSKRTLVSVKLPELTRSIVSNKTTISKTVFAFNTLMNIHDKDNTNINNDNRVTNLSTIDRIHKGRRAVRVIGVLFGMFIICYLPFFIVYAIDVICNSCNYWTDIVMAHVEWLGYLSSMLNPFVYHSFNPTFRRTFRKMMHCACYPRQVHKNHAVWRTRL